MYALMTAKMTKPMLSVLNGQKPSRVPWWMMRQAGRYLPEYRDLRAKAGGFLDLVYDSEKAAEITVQPLRRFGMDAAILFSDILIVPHAMGQELEFAAGEGPKLDALNGPEDLKKLTLDKIDAHCQPVYDTVAKTHQKLSEEGFDETALIGFCGSPWTVICYMVEGGGSRDFEKAKHWALNDPQSFGALVDMVTQASLNYLDGQIRAGAEIIQLFESWGGILDGAQFERWVIAPTQKIVSHLKKNHPNIPVIGFPRGAGSLIENYAVQTGIDAVSLDYTVDCVWAARQLQTKLPVQGNLDPVRLLTGGAALEEGLASIEKTLGKGPLIFNLGHGVIKETDIAHVETLARTVKGWKV